MYHHKLKAMGCPCEILIQSKDIIVCNSIIRDTIVEINRIEYKYSRYIKGSFLSNLNLYSKAELDDETYYLIQIADNAYNLSNGLFDITSGILRKVWSFTPNASFPNKKQIQDLIPFIGWRKVFFNKNSIILPKGFEIDLGGIVKEYAVDKIVNDLNNKYKVPFLINLGGDLSVSDTRGEIWKIGIDDVSEKNIIIDLTKGSIATSGDTYRYIIQNNKKYSHILNPFTGYPIENPPKSVTVIAKNCIIAGLITTIAILQGKNAEVFLKKQKLKYYIQV